MSRMLKRLAGRLPSSLRDELKRSYYAWQIRCGRFRTPEPEFALLDQLVQPGGWVIDIGANVGHYTARMSRLVGPAGRVVALEPVPQTFRLLVENARLFAHANVTFLNVAASDRAAITGIEVPDGDDGPYLARLSPNAPQQVLCLPIDSLDLPSRVALVKIDAEGHEPSVLRGMAGLIERDRPTLIVEAGNAATQELHLPPGYKIERLPGSPNCIFRPELLDAAA